MVPIPKGFMMEFYWKYTIPYTLYLNSLKKDFWNIIWEFSSISRSHVSFQGQYIVLNKYFITPIFHWETMWWAYLGGLSFVGSVGLPLSYFLFSLSSLILSHGTLEYFYLCDTFFLHQVQRILDLSPWLCLPDSSSKTLSYPFISSSSSFSSGRINKFTIVFLSKVSNVSAK